jgi:centrosomal protein CEP76
MFVATRRHASAAVLWDPLSGRRFDLVELAARAAAAASAAAAEPPLPMRSVHCAFNHVSFFANVQRADSVLAVTWDFEAAAHWRALSAEAIALLPAAPAPALAPCSLSPAREAELLEARLRALVAEFRAQQCGLPTAWDSALGELLSPALASYEAERAVGAGFAGDDVELAVRRALPLGAVFRAFPAQFPHRNAAAILTALSQAVSARARAAALCPRPHAPPPQRGGALLETLRLDAEDLFFAVRARVVPYADEVAATWVVVAARFRAPPPPPPPA